MSNYEFRVDKSKNRLYAHIEGFFHDDNANEALEELKKILPELRPDFDVVMDLTGLKPATQNAVEILASAAQLVAESGRRRAVRISSEYVAGTIQFKRSFKDVSTEDNVQYAGSVEEADRILDEWDKS